MEMTKHRTISISFTTKQEGGKEQTLTMTVSDEFIPVWDMDQPNPVALSMPRILEELRSQDREVPTVSKKETPLPPMGKQPKITTVEELIEGVDGNAIKRFAKEQQGASPTPPTPKTVVPKSDKKIKRYTVEEKTEIAMMYAEGMPVATIAEKFGRNPNAIMVLVNKMGVKRGDNPVDPEQAAASKPASKGGSVLKKPWYLQSQKPNNKDKVKHE